MKFAFLFLGMVYAILDAKEILADMSCLCEYDGNRFQCVPNPLEPRPQNTAIDVCLCPTDSGEEINKFRIEMKSEGVEKYVPKGYNSHDSITQVTQIDDEGDCLYVVKIRLLSRFFETESTDLTVETKIKISGVRTVVTETFSLPLEKEIPDTTYLGEFLDPSDYEVNACRCYEVDGVLTCDNSNPIGLYEKLDICLFTYSNEVKVSNFNLDLQIGEGGSLQTFYSVLMDTEGPQEFSMASEVIQDTGNADCDYIVATKLPLNFYENGGDTITVLGNAYLIFQNGKQGEVSPFNFQLPLEVENKAFSRVFVDGVLGFIQLFYSTVCSLLQ